MLRRFPLYFLPLLALGGLPLFLAGCPRSTTPSPHSTEQVEVVPGVTFRRVAEGSGFQVLDVDLHTAQVRPTVVAEDVERLRNNFVGEAKTVPEWVDQHGAIGGINAGFFGQTYDEVGQRKQLVQLAVVQGKVVAPGSDIRSTRRPGERYLRSAVGFLADGTPQIAWATGTMKGVIKRYEAPVNPPPGTLWPVASAVACGPRLFDHGRRRITEREERLASPGRLVRAFVAYDLGPDRKPAHLLLGRANAAEFADVANFVESYFRRTHNAAVSDAMCFDGGASGQIVYRDPQGGLVDAEPTGVRVPTAVLLLPPQKGSPSPPPQPVGTP